jgi:hypothetical protein
MLKVTGVLLNLGILIYLGFKALSCLSPQELIGLNFTQNPLFLSLVGVLALFIVVRN